MLVAQTTDRLQVSGRRRIDPAGPLERLGEDPSVAVETHLVYGDPVYEIGRLVRDESCDLVVVTVKNRSRVGKLMMGSKAQDLILSSTVPVLTVRREES